MRQPAPRPSAAPNRGALIGLLGLLAVPGAGAATAETVFFVDDDAPGGAGTSWDTAWRTLQDALAAAGPGSGIEEIRVAQGVYRPDDGESQVRGDRTASFSLLPGVAVRGGWAGVTEPDPDVRDIDLYETVLTGDLDGNDGPGLAGNGENSHQVVRVESASSTSRLEGFVIEGGNADGRAPRDRGAGIYLVYDFPAPLVADCTVSRCEAVLGGGIFVTGAGVMRRVIVQDCAATLGGGVFAERALGRFEDCRLEDNTALFGAGLYAEGGGPALDDATVRGNGAALNGGGVYAIDADLQVTGGLFEINSALAQGGGLYQVAGAPELDGCVFRENVADAGGGLYAVGSRVTLTGVWFEGNFAFRGGGLLDTGGDGLVTRCTFLGNRSETGGGGAWAIDGAVTFDDCTWTGNDGTAGGGLYLGPGTPVVRDCIFGGNRAFRLGGGLMIDGADAEVVDCLFSENDVEGGFVADGGGLRIENSDGSRVLRCQFVENTANSGGAVSMSFAASELRECEFLGNSASIGGAAHVPLGGALVADCRFEGNAADGLSIALGGAAYFGETGGVVTGSTFVVNMSNDAGGAVYAAAGVTLTDCVFTENAALGDGGAVFAGGDGELARCRFDVNTAAGAGGAVLTEGTSRLEACVLAGNTASQGGGVFNPNEDVFLVNCLFTGNRATGARDEMGECVFAGLGGAIGSLGGRPEVIGCTFSANEAECSGIGGGIAWITGVLANSVLWGNVDAGGSDESAQVTGVTQADYSCIQGLTGALGGEGNVGLDPDFVDPAGPDGTVGTGDDDLHLAPGSPCIDAGSNPDVPVGVTTDLDGGARFVDDPATPDTGRGDPPLVDIGAYELAGGVTCDADLDGSGVVDVADLIDLLAAWGPCPPAPTCPGDVDGNGVVEVRDLLMLLQAWGPCP